MLRLLCCTLLLSLWMPAFAQNNSINLALPGTAGSYQSDSFRANGLDCSMAIGSATNVEFGVIGVINKSPTTITTDLNMQQRDVGVYGRITIPIGAPRTRLDCNELYQLELKKKRMEVQKLERELQNLRALKFENAVNK
jgi:hypothetical protein